MARRDSHALLVGITLMALTVGPAAAQDAPRVQHANIRYPPTKRTGSFCVTQIVTPIRGTRLSTCYSAITCMPHSAERLAYRTNGLAMGILD